MTSVAPAKPSYLGLLNAIALGESRAGVQLAAWAAATKDEFLRETLTFVAKRETSHGDVFRRRIQEFGFDVLERPDPKSEERLKVLADASIPDVKKLGRDEGEGEGTDFFGKIEEDMANGVFDPLTTDLMRWYIAEERDSGERLRVCSAMVRAKA